MKTFYLALYSIFFLFLIASCTCDCKKHSEAKIDKSLKEAFANNEKAGMNQAFIVQIDLYSTCNDDIKNQLSESGIIILETAGSTIKAKGTRSVIEKVSSYDYIAKINLLTESVYPNR